MCWILFEFVDRPGRFDTLRPSSLRETCMRRTLLPSALALLFVVPATAQEPVADPAPLLRSGPMLGPAEVSETSLWLQTRQPARAQIRFWESGKPQTARLSDEVSTSAASDLIARFRLDRLRFGTGYEYEIYLDGLRLARPYPLDFATQPFWRWRSDPPDVRIAFGSCAYINDPPYDRPGPAYGGDYPIFASIAAQHPDLMLWLGDDIYYREPDLTTEAGMRRRWAVDRSLPELQSLLAATHHYAMWDDHDYGPDDSDWTFRDRDTSFRIFRDYWLNPSYGTREQPGVYTRFEWGDVEVFLLDGRSFRSPDDAKPGPEKRMYGAAQMKWLEDGLVGSKATFKIVAGGSQFFNPVTHSEGMGSYPAERQELLDFLAASQIPGVVFLSGDRHFTEVLKRQDGMAYPIYEYTSSPLTSGPAKPAPDELGNPLRVANTLVVGQRNFGLIEVGGKPGERKLTMRALGVKGQELWKVEVRQGELRPASPPPQRK
jgi:alkaline phosphatase D